MSTITKEWWEAVCQQLNRDPSEATKTITEFYDSDQALEASKYFLQQSTGCSAAAQFQAAIVLQHACLKQWTQLAPGTIQDLRTTLWTLIHASLVAGSMSPFALNKIIQVYALLWKRGWAEANQAQRNDLFQQIGAFLQVQELMKTGSAMLRIIVEEFCSRSSAEIGLPLEFHRIAHMSFEKHGLDDAVHIASQCLSVAIGGLQGLEDPSNTAPVTRASINIGEASKLIVEVLSWDFGNVDRFTWSGSGKASVEKEKVRSNELLNLPRSWAQYFLQPAFIDSIFNSYDQLRSLLLKNIEKSSRGSGGGSNNHHHHQQHPHQASAGSSVPFGSPAESALVTNSIVTALGELRLLITALSSVSGSFFQDDSERIQMANYIVTRLVPLLDGALATKPPLPDSNGNVISLSISAISAIDELRSQECVQYGAVLLRLLGNFRLQLVCQMPQFEAMMISLGRATFELSRELADMAEGQLVALFSGKGSGGCLFGGEPGLLDGWRAEAVEMLLESWCMVIDDPVMLQDSVASSFGDDDYNSPRKSTVVSVQLRTGMRSIGADVFKQLFECILRTSLCESLKSLDEEEDEDNEAIEGRTMDDLLGAVCTVGRTNFGTSVTHVCTSLGGALQDTEKLLLLLQQGGQGGNVNSDSVHRESIRILETLRIGVLFVSHLCVDDFQGSITGSATSDTPTIPPFVLDAFAQSVCDVGGLVRQLVALMSQILQAQMHILALNNGISHPLLSPLLIQNLFHFFAEYALRYFDPDPSLYSVRVALEIPIVYTVHGEDIHNIIDLLATSSHRLLLTMPLESELIRAVAQTFAALSKCGFLPGAEVKPQFATVLRQQRQHPRVVERLLALPAVSQIFLLVTGKHQQDQLYLDGGGPHGHPVPEHQPGLCRLNSDGISAMFSALCNVTIRANSDTSFTQLCVSAHNRVSSAAAAAAPHRLAAARHHADSSKWLVEHAIACLKGIAGSPSGQDRILHSLFDESLPTLSSCMQVFTSADDILKSHIQLLRDYAEAQLSSCGTHSSHALYNSCLQALQQCSARLNLPYQKTAAAASSSSGGGGGGNSFAAASDEESVYRSELLLIVLQLLNHLATKEFLIDDDDDNTTAGGAAAGAAGADISVSAAASLGQTVASVLIYGLECIVPLLSADLLRSFPTVADRYFSYVTFMVGTYESELAARIRGASAGVGGVGAGVNVGVNTGVQFLGTLVEHLLWGAGAVDTCSARLALQAMQTLALHQFNEMRVGREGFGVTNSAGIFPKASERLMEMLLFPNSCEYGISWDRLDGCANAMLALIALDVGRFTQCVNALVMQQPEFIRAPLIASFEKLTTVGGVSLSKVDKPNRLIFVKNLRQFVLEVRPFVLYH